MTNNKIDIKDLEAVTQAICKSGKFETGEGTCAFVCMDQLGDARQGLCSHALGIHNKLAKDVITAYLKVLEEEGKRVISEHDLQELVTNRKVYEG